MSERIMSRPLDPGAGDNWDNTFGRKERPQYVPPEVETIVLQAPVLKKPRVTIIQPEEE